MTAGSPLGWVLAGTILLTIVLAWALLRNTEFERGIASDIAQVSGTSTTITAPRLPKIVSDFALRNGGSTGREKPIQLEHRAMLTVDRDRPPISVRAEQWLSPTHSAIAWVGRGGMFGIPVTVIDSFVAGRGRLEARLLGTLKVAGGSGPDFDKGELQRYLSELPVHPDAILNNGALHWEQLDGRTVEVTAESGTGRASVMFMFDADGDIVGMLAPDRPMSVDVGTVPTKWRGSYAEYRHVGAYRIPTHGEVGWEFPDGLFTYWRGDIVAYDGTRP